MPFINTYLQAGRDLSSRVKQHKKALASNSTVDLLWYMCVSISVSLQVFHAFQALGQRTSSETWIVFYFSQFYTSS